MAMGRSGARRRAPAEGQGKRTREVANPTRVMKRSSRPLIRIQTATGTRNAAIQWSSHSREMAVSSEVGGARGDSQEYL
jgi:hypothetical protein